MVSICSTFFRAPTGKDADSPGLTVPAERAFGHHTTGLAFKFCEISHYTAVR